MDEIGQSWRECLSVGEAARAVVIAITNSFIHAPGGGFPLSLSGSYLAGMEVLRRPP